MICFSVNSRAFAAWSEEWQTKISRLPRREEEYSGKCVRGVVREMVERGNRWGDPSGTAANPEVNDCFVNNAACAERRERLPT